MSASPCRVPEPAIPLPAKHDAAFVIVHAASFRRSAAQAGQTAGPRRLSVHLGGPLCEIYRRPMPRPHPRRDKGAGVSSSWT